MDYQKFIKEQIAELKQTVGTEKAINALSGGVDSSTVTVLGHRALGDKLKTVFVDSALMRKGEPQRVVKLFADMGIPVELVDAREEVLSALAGLTDPEEKRQAVTDTFYSKVFVRLVNESGAKLLL
ncbi:MAG: asparagine synthase-related protein, partial [Planctomycetota bacterium]